MPLTLNDNQLWARIKKVEGQEFALIQTRQPYKVVNVANKGVTTENVQAGKTCRLSREDVTLIYERVKKCGKWTGDDHRKARMKWMRLAQIMALLALAVPEEIAPFTQAQGQRLFGKSHRGIRDVGYPAPPPTPG